MSQRVNIPSQNQPFRRQSSIGGNVSFRNIGENEDNSFITLAKVTRVYYKQGKLDFKLTNTNSLVADQSGNGSGSAPIPVDFFGRRPNGKVFGHYRPVKIGDLIAVAYVNGHKSSPIVIGVYPNSGQDYEIISPSLYLDGDDNNSGIAETALAEQKIYPSMQLEYRSGSGTIAKALNGHSFLVVDDETSVQYSKLWQNYNTVGFFHSDSDDINPLKETAGDWLLVHEDNPLSDKGDNHRTRFFVNKKGEIQIVLMDNTSSGTISVLEGSKDNGFTISQYYDLTKTKSGDLSDDVYEPDFKSATDYVSLNIGKGKQIALDAAGQTKLVIKKDGIYYNGKPLSKAIINSESNSITKSVKDQITSSDYWKNFQDTINKASSEARDAAEQAKQAGEVAKAAGAAAEAAGKNALDTGDDIKKNVIYYANKYKGLHPGLHLDGDVVAITGKSYIEDSVINSAMIEDGAIDHAKIANEAVWSSQIANLAVTRAKIADAAIGSAQIEDLAVTDAKIGSLSADKITTGTLDAGKITVINLNAESITAGTITADKLKIGKLSEITGDAGQLIKGHIQASDDPNSGVQIDGLDADDPNKYTPAKKAFLLSEVKKLNSAAEAAIDYGKQTGVDYSAVEKAKQAMDDGLAPLLGDMATTTEFDYNTVIKLEQDLQDAINAFHSKSNSDIMAQIGTTADGKNAIYRGANDPVTMGVQPHENDMWLQILSNGTYNIRVWDGAQWINPGLADIKAVSDSLSNLPKSYYQAEEPVGDSVHDGDTWYKLTKGSDGKYTYVAYKREGNSWTPLLNAGEVSNQSSISTLQSDLEQARELIKDDGGGINLYTGTENFSDIAGRSWFHRSDANWTLTDRRDPNGNLEMQKNGGAWNGLGQAISVEPGKYTFSCYLWVHLTGNETLNFYAGDNQYGGTATVGATDGTTQFTVNDSEKYIHVTITYNVTKGGVLAIRPELNQDSGTFWVSSYKLEKGSQATPWCHNGNDYMAGIAAVQEDVNSATAAIQQAKASAASDAAKIRADVAKIESEVASAKSASQDSINTLQNDINTAKQDLANVHDSLTKAQSAVEQNQKLINDSVAKINNDIAQDRKDLATAQQNNADLAKQLDDYSKQAEAQGKTIEKLQTDDNSTKLTIADIKGNVSQVQGSVTGLTANLKDANDNLATVKALADSLSSTLTDHGKSIVSLQATAKELSSTLGDADGRLSKVEQTAKEQSTTLSAVQGNLSQVKQTADGLTDTLKDAQGDITKVQATAKGLSDQITNAQGAITNLQTDVTGIKATIADHDKNIHTLQADSKSLTDDMTDAQGNISKLQKTSTDLTSEMQDHDGRLSKVEQTAGTLTNEFADQQGHLNRVEQTANGTQQTVANQQGQINTIKTDASSIHETLTGQGNQIANINVTLNGLNTKYEGVSGDLSKLKDSNQWKTVTGAFDANQYTQTARIFYQDTQAKNTPDSGWFYLMVEAPETNRITQNLIKDNSNDSWSRFYSGEWSSWTRGITQLDIDSLSHKITTNSTQITQNKKEVDLKADQSTVDNLSGEVSQAQAQLKVQAGQISQKVSSAEYQTLRDKVNGIQVGTSNLLHDTSDQWRTLTNDGCWLQKTTASSCWTSTSDYHGGNEFTYAAKITNNSHQQAELEIWLCDQNKNLINGQAFHAPIPKGANAYDVNVTFPITTGTWYIRSWIIFTGGHAPHGDQIQVKDERLVRGNLAGTWEANPTDTITSIQKNTTAIDENSKAIKLKADQTEVNNVKSTAQQLSSRLDIMAGEIKSKVSSTDVNNIVDSKGYATQNTVQSLIDQKAGKINESITNLEGKFNSSSSVNLAEKTNQGTTNWTVDPGNGASTISEVNINGIRGVRFTQTRKSTSWWVIAYQLNLDYFEPNQDYIISFDVRTSSDNFNRGGMLNIARGDSSHAYLANTSFRTNFKKNQLTHVSCTGHSYSSLDKNGETFYLDCVGLGQCDWIDIVNLKIARGTIDKGYSPAPSDNATVTQVQSLTASIDGLKSIVVNKDGITSMINQKADSIEAGITGKLSSLNYGGLILDKNGATLTSGNTHVYLNGTNGFQIQNGTSDVFHVDRSGNLNMQGNITGGNITGVNFTGNNLTLAGDLRVINKEDKVGHILLGNTAVLDSQGLSIKGAGLSISDNQGNQTTYVDQYGTFTTKKGVFNGSVTATSLTIREGSQADINVAGNFRVDNNGNVTAKSITITGNRIDNVSKLATIEGANITGNNLIQGNIIIGNTITGGTINGSVFRTLNGQNRLSNFSRPYFSDSGSKSFRISKSGLLTAENSVLKVLNNRSAYTLTIGDKKGTFSNYIGYSGSKKNLTTDFYRYGVGQQESPSSQGVVGYYYYGDDNVPDGRADPKGTVILPVAWIKNNPGIGYMYLQYYLGVDASNVVNGNFRMVAFSPNYKNFSFSNDKTTGLDYLSSFNYDRFNFSDTDISGKYIRSNNFHIPTGMDTLYMDEFDLSTFSVGSDICFGIAIYPEQVADRTHPWGVAFTLESFSWGSESVGDVTLNVDESHGSNVSSQSLNISNNGALSIEYVGDSSGGTNVDYSYINMNKGMIDLTASQPGYGTRKTMKTTISGTGIDFNTFNVSDPNDVYPITFRGTATNTGGQTGIQFDGYGNIHAQVGAGVWRVYNNQGDEVFNVPFDPNGVFNFYVPRVNKNTHPEHKWGGLKIGWVYFDQPQYNWAETVPAIYNTGGRVKGIAMFDQYLISFVDGWCYQLSSWWNHGVPDGVDSSKGAAEGTNTDAGHRGV